MGAIEDNAEMQETFLDEMFPHYVTCALWSSHDDDGVPLDSEYGPDDIDENVSANMRADCESFVVGAWHWLVNDGENAPVSTRSMMQAEQVGHDFWLTRNGHGAGFWDRGTGAVGDALTKLAKPYGGCDLYVGDDGRVYAMGLE